MPKCTVTSVTNLETNSGSPILIEFQNALPPSSESAVTVRQNEKTKATEVEIRYGNDDKRLYKGTVGEGYPEDLVKTYLAIRNKETNEIRLIEARQCCVKSSHHFKKESETNKAIDVRSLLYKNFGSKSASRAIEKKERTAFNSDIVKNKLDESVSQVMSDSLLVDKEEDDESGVCPPCNKDATKVSDIYTLEKTIPKEVLNLLEGPSAQLVLMKPMHMPFTTPFVMNTVKAVQVSELADSKPYKDRLKISIILDCLVNILNSNSKMSDLAKPVSEYLAENFMQKPGGKRKLFMTKQCTQKAICYYIVLAFLTTTNYVLNLSLLLEGLNVSKKDAIKYARFVGAVHQVRTDTIALKLRSNKPASESNYRKRKRNSM